jgi:CubicO group peptidase (beta-lactamase class C family)
VLTTVVGASRSSSGVVEETSFQAEDLDSARFAQLEQLITDDYFRQIRGVVVLKGGRILYENYFNGATREALQDIRSAGKSITSALVGIALDKGYLTDIHQPLLSFFPEYDRTTNWDSRKDSITLDHTLRMSIGLDLSDGNYAEGSYGNVETYGENWIIDVLSKPMAFDPGSMFDYSSGAVSLCGPVIRRASGMTVPAFADSFLFRPLGITNYRWTRFPDGHVCASGSFWMRAIDFAKFGQLYLQRGRWNGEQLISDDWIDLSTRERFVPAPWVKIGYGYYWWREEYYFNDRVIECFYAQGNGGNRVHVFPSEDVVIAVTSSAYGEPYMMDQVRMMINAFILPASILPRGTYDSDVSILTVPTVGLVISGLVLASALLIWPIGPIRRRKHCDRENPKSCGIFPGVARILLCVCALIHLAFILLIFWETSFELFLNTGYKYEIPTFHLTVNWLLTISAGLALLCSVPAYTRRWRKTTARLHVIVVAGSCCYVLYVVHSWEALILFR